MPRYDGSLRTLLGCDGIDERAMEIFTKIINGVEAAHLGGVTHRDLKPENILIRGDGDELVVADFGVARFMVEELFTTVETKPNTRLANFLYAAPEQRNRGARVDNRADIYALGLILNELFTGSVPAGTKYKSIGATVEEFEFLDSLVADMLSQNPSDRPENIREVRQAVNASQREYLAHQKLSVLNGIVIPEGEIDDPLAFASPEIVDVDWRNNTLTLILDRPVNDKWVLAFQSTRHRRHYSGRGPAEFQFSGTNVSVLAYENEPQRIIDEFKQWLPNVTAHYKNMLESEIRDVRNAELQKKKVEIEQEEQRNRVMQRLKY